jgi:hypothetical protein
MRPSFAFSGPRLRSHSTGVATALTITVALQLSASETPERAAVDALERFLARPSLSHQYRASRRLEASGVGQRGWLDVVTSFTPASGLQYEVTAEGGSGYIRGRVLRSLLNEEQRLIAIGDARRVALSRENYLFTPKGVNDEGLAVVVLKPLRKDRSLIAGQILLSPLDGELIRLEGRLAKNPSFWVTRVDVVRSYRRINGVLMPVSLETTGRLRFLGSSALRMTYSYSHIDDQPVGEQRE